MKPPQSRIDRYRIETLLGRGGMGEVYEATDTRLGRRVALKLLPEDADPAALQRMLREARAASSFEHPNAVMIFDAGEVEGSAYIAMELVRGHSLRAQIGDGGVSIARRLRWLVDIASALGAAHAAGLVHRDVKPDNVMIRDDGTVKVLDFGIARRRSAPVDPSAPTEQGALGTITNEGVVVGTPLYAAPEQLRGEDLDGRADQFAWGVTAYELLSGAPPWRGADSIALLSQILSADPPPLRGKAPDVPEEVERAVARALAKNPADRFATIEEAAAALEPFADAGAPTGNRQRTPRTGPPPPPTSTAAAAPPSRVLRVARGFGRATLWFLAALGALLVGVIALAIVLKAVTGRGHITIGDDPEEISALGCSPAKLDRDAPGRAAAAAANGDDARFDLARAIGLGACARLATEVGIPWNVADAEDKLAVTVRVHEGLTEATLEVAGREAQGKGGTPIEAVSVAVSSLSKKLRPPPLDEERIKSWGARDADSARRIERLWRRMVLALLPSYEQQIHALVESDPDSPWPHAFLTLTGSPGAEEGRKRALELLDKLPAGRRDLLAGLFMAQQNPGKRVEALRLMRQGYAQAGDDPDVAGLYAAVVVAIGATEEGFAVVDRISSRFPTLCMLPIHSAVGDGVQPDVARDRRLLERMWAVLPESIGWRSSVRHFLFAGQNAEARKALELAEQLGMGTEATDRAEHDTAAALLELAELAPGRARDRAAPLLADPNVSSVTSGSRLLIAAYHLEGRMTDAEATGMREIQRQRSGGNPILGAAIALRLARVARWAGRPAPSEAELALVEKTLGNDPLGDAGRLAMLCEVALLRLGSDRTKNKAAAERVLAEAEAAAERDADGDRRVRDDALLATLPLLRALRGDGEASKRWLDTTRASYAARSDSAYEAALALEAAGHAAEAEKAYLLAQNPAAIDRHGFERVASEVHLGRLLRSQGRAEEAARHESVVDRLWSAAEPGLREAVARAR